MTGASVAVCGASVFSAINQIKYSIMKIAVYGTDSQLIWREATKDSLANSLKELIGEEGQSSGWRDCQVFVDGRRVREEDFEGLVSAENFQAAEVVVLRTPLEAMHSDYSSEPLLIYLREVNGKTLKVPVYATQTLSVLKNALVSKYGVPSSEWSLVFKGRPLTSDSDLLLQHHILNKSIIHAIREVSDPELQVRFLNVTTKEHIPFNLRADEKIGDVRVRLAERLQLKSDELFLVYCGGELLDDKTVGQYRVAPGAGLFVLIKKDIHPNQFTPGQTVELTAIQPVISRCPEERSSPKRVLVYDGEPSEVPPPQQTVGIATTNTERAPEGQFPSIIIPATNATIQDAGIELQSPVMALMGYQKEESDISQKGSDASPGFSPLIPYNMRRRTTTQQGSEQGTTLVLNSISEYVENTGSEVEISNSAEARKEHNPLADARILEDRGCQVKQVESIIISDPEYKLMEVKHVQSLIEKSDNSQAESFLDAEAADGRDRVTQSLRPKASYEKKDNPAYISSIESQQVGSSSKLLKNILSESIELQPKRIVIQRKGGLSCSQVVTPMETILQLKKRLEGHHGLPADRMILLLDEKPLADDCTFVEMRLQKDSEFTLKFEDDE